MNAISFISFKRKLKKKTFSARFRIFKRLLNKDAYCRKDALGRINMANRNQDRQCQIMPFVQPEFLIAAIVFIC